MIPQVIPQQFVPQQFIPQVIPQQFIPQPVIPQQIIPQQVVGSTFDPRNQAQPVFRPDDDKRRNNPYYDIFPRDEDIEKILDVADCGKIRDIIKYVGDSGFQCRESANFLDKFQAKIQSRIAIYRAEA